MLITILAAAAAALLCVLSASQPAERPVRVHVRRSYRGEGFGMSTANGADFGKPAPHSDHCSGGAPPH